MLGANILAFLLHFMFASTCMCIHIYVLIHDYACMCVHVFLQPNLASGQGTGDPDEIQCFEGNQDKADIGRQVLGALWVHEVVGGVAASVFLIAHRRGQVYPGVRETNSLRNIHLQVTLRWLMNCETSTVVT